MTLAIDEERGRRVAPELYALFHSSGIHERTEMPEDTMPPEIELGSLGHVVLLTLTVALDYQRDASALWAAAIATYEDPETRYLFSPGLVHEASPKKIIQDMQKHKLSKKPQRDADIWRTNAITFFKKYDGDPRNFLKICDLDAPTVIERLRNDCHDYNKRPVNDFPNLRGKKIGPLWLRMLRDNAGIELKRLDEMPIPVDVHVARATLALGVVKGTFDGPVEELHEVVRKAWRNSVKDLQIGSRPMIALDIDEPLWHLSKYGCTFRDEAGSCPKQDCEMRRYCVPGKIELGVRVEVDT